MADEQVFTVPLHRHEVVKLFSEALDNYRRNAESAAEMFWRVNAQIADEGYADKERLEQLKRATNNGAHWLLRVHELAGILGHELVQ